ncbi:MAG: twin-arginine translocase subunit TatC, partial [Lachnospiraceae bacterium]|nr:twin-arginine translocase subunit TatC [Lachnospiraceae bacterium]
MTVREHLRELKKRFLRCLIVYAVCFIAVFIYSNVILGIILEGAVKSGFELITISVSEAMIQRFRIAGVGALLISFPYILWHAFVFWSQPEKLPSKLKTVLAVIGVTAVFIAGAAFAVFKMIPFMLSFLYEVTAGVEGVKAAI